MGGSILHDTGVPTELPEDRLEQASPGQVGTTQGDTVREGVRWRNIVCQSWVGGEGAWCVVRGRRVSQQGHIRKGPQGPGSGPGVHVQGSGEP